MMERHGSSPADTHPTTAARMGYLAVIGVNAALLVVANNLLAWNWLPFLTDDFALVLPILNLSFGASIAVNAAYLSYDSPWFKSLTRLGLAGIGLAVAARFYAVFPFDFTPVGYDWSTAARGLLLLAMAGSGLAVVSELVRLMRAVIVHREGG